MGVVKSPSICYSTGIAGVSRLDTPARVSGSWRKSDMPPARLGGCASRSQNQHPGRLEPAARAARPIPHGVTLTTFIDQTPNLTRPRVEPEPDATAADLATLEAED